MVKMIANQTGIALALAALLTSFSALAQPSSIQLLSLVPPDSQLVAGAAAPIQQHNRGQFLLFARANILDLEDFFSMTGADASCEIDQVVFAAAAGKDVTRPEHSLLASGHFNSDRIYASAKATTTVVAYHGVHLVVVHPFARERAVLDSDRWLVIIDSHLAIFGTSLSVQQEIDRFIEGASPDLSLLSRLRALRNDDETWCMVSSLMLGTEIARALEKLDPAFAEIDKDTNTLLFGIRYGRQIEFEYVVDAEPTLPIKTIPPSPVENPAAPANARFSLLSSTPPVQDKVFRRVVRIPKTRYEKWLSNLTPH